MSATVLLTGGLTAIVIVDTVGGRAVTVTDGKLVPVGAYVTVLLTGAVDVAVKTTGFEAIVVVIVVS